MPATGQWAGPGERKNVFERFSIKPKGEKSNPAEKQAPKKQPKPPAPERTTELTPELREQILQSYKERYEESDQPWRSMVAEVSSATSAARQVVSKVLREYKYPHPELTPEQRERAIEMYAGYVERGERPPDGRRRTIAKALGVTFMDVKNAVYEWSKTRYQQSQTPELRRENYFAIEKAYWAELDNPRYPLHELPGRLADQLGFVNSYQVARWLDMLHEDINKFAQIPDVEAEIEQRIIEAYQAYLAAPSPPEQGLHTTIAAQISGITKHQVHKVLQKHRLRRRAEYPLS
jgi:hypothetical protein